MLDPKKNAEKRIKKEKRNKRFSNFKKALPFIIIALIWITGLLTSCGKETSPTPQELALTSELNEAKETIVLLQNQLITTADELKIEREKMIIICPIVDIDDKSVTVIIPNGSIHIYKGIDFPIDMDNNGKPYATYVAFKGNLDFPEEWEIATVY